MCLSFIPFLDPSRLTWRDKSSGLVGLALISGREPQRGYFCDNLIGRPNDDGDDDKTGNFFPFVLRNYKSDPHRHSFVKQTDRHGMKGVNVNMSRDWTNRVQDLLSAKTSTATAV